MEGAFFQSKDAIGQIGHNYAPETSSAGPRPDWMNVGMMIQGIIYMRFERNTIDPLATGKASIRNLRFPVSRLLGLLAAGETKESIFLKYPYLEAPDIDAALRYAASLAKDETIELNR